MNKNGIESEFEKNWSQLQTWIAKLKEHYSSANADEVELDFVRKRTLHALEDILLSDVVSAVKKQVPSLLWKHVFYSHVEMFKSRLKSNETSLAELRDELVFAKHYLRQLMCRLSSLKHPHDVRTKSAITDAIYKFMIALGDLCRYQATFKLTFDLKEASKWYKNAYILCPALGNAHAQLGLISSYEKNDLCVHYYYWLSFGNVQPVSLSQENISRLYARYDPNQIPDSTSLSSSPLVFNYLLCLAALYDPSRDISLLVSCEAVFSDFIGQGDFASWISHIQPILVPMLIEAVDFNRHFELAENAHQKKHARSRQMLLLAMSMDLSIHAAKLFLRIFSHSNEELGEENDKSERVLKQSLQIIGILMTFFIAQPQLIKVYQEYSLQLDTRFESRFSDCVSLLCDMFNAISEIADVDETPTKAELDIDLVGLQSLSSFYGEVKTRHHPPSASSSEEMQIVFSRIGLWLQSVEKSGTVSFLKYELTRNIYYVESRRTKEKQLLEVMKTMAAQKLSSDVEALELEVKQKQAGLNIPAFVVDLNTMLYELNLVKGWVISRQSIIIVPHEVIQQLDFLKKGMDSINVQARQTIRYLESRLRSQTPYLIAQPQSKQTPVTSPVFSTTKGTSSASTSTLEYMNCCQVYLKKHTSEALWMVSDDDEVQQEAQKIGIAICTPKQVTETVKQRKTRKRHEI